MKGFLKGCLITALVSICIGVVISTAAIATGGWPRIVDLAKNGEFVMIYMNDNVSGWYDWYHHRRWDDGWAEAEAAWEDSWAEAEAAWEDSWAEAEEAWEDGWEDLDVEWQEAIEDVNSSWTETWEEVEDREGNVIQSYKNRMLEREAAVVGKRADVKNLDIEIKGGAFYLLQSDMGDDNFRIIEENGSIKYSCYQEGDTIYFEEERGYRPSDYNNRKVYLTVPKNLELEQVTIALGGGLAFLERVEAKDVDISAGAGELVIKALKAEEAKLQIGAGQIVSGNSYVKNMSLDVGVGDIMYAGQITNDLDATCGMGAIQMLLEGSGQEYNYELSTGAGEIQVGGISCSGVGKERFIDNGASGNFNMECGMGSIFVAFDE